MFEALDHVALGPAQLPNLTSDPVYELQQILVAALLHPDFPLFPKPFYGLRSNGRKMSLVGVLECASPVREMDEHNLSFFMRL